MKKIILVTNAYPYFPGEQFLETEVKYLNGLDLTVLPLKDHHQKRTMPSFVKLDVFIADRKDNFFTKIFYLLRSTMSLIFYQELFNEVGLNVKKIKSFLSSMYSYQRYYSLFDAYFEGREDLNEVILYTYWNNTAAYALQSLKEKYNYKIVSRIHGYDLYKERKENLYMPLKKRFTENIDAIFTITEKANEYLVDNYGFDRNVISVSRLGVDDNFIKSKSSSDGFFSIASCSFMVDVKRVDKIIDSLSLLAKSFPYIKFEWRHMGNGPLKSMIEKRAFEKLSVLHNVKYEFSGLLHNQEVYELYENNSIDVFINVSESEGVPVSIMEAMSCSIPIVAPDVGGISDMVSNEFNGILLSEKCDVYEIVDALSDFDFFKSSKTRENSYLKYLLSYNARVNYKKFIKTLSEL